jgi:hypothetical protein
VFKPDPVISLERFGVVVFTRGDFFWNTLRERIALPITQVVQTLNTLIAM